MSVKITGQTPQCCDNCTEADVESVTLNSTNAQIRFHLQQWRLHRFFFSTVGSTTPVAGAFTADPSVGSKGSIFNFTFSTFSGQVNVEVSDPKHPGCPLQLISWTGSGQSPAPTPPPPS